MSAAAVPASPSSPTLWTRGDLNAFFGLGINMLVNVLVLAGLAAGVVKIPGGDVFGVGSSRVDLQACKLEYSIVSPK